MMTLPWNFYQLAGADMHALINMIIEGLEKMIYTYLNVVFESHPLLDSAVDLYLKEKKNMMKYLEKLHELKRHMTLKVGFLMMMHMLALFFEDTFSLFIVNYHALFWFSLWLWSGLWLGFFMVWMVASLMKFLYNKTKLNKQWDFYMKFNFVNFCINMFENYWYDLFIEIMKKKI